MASAIDWFDIPVDDMERARVFYAEVLGGDLGEPQAFNDGHMSILPHSNGVGGALVKSKLLEPSSSAGIIYLNGGDDLSKPLGRVEAAGGKVIADKMSIGPNGYIALFLDTEGNRVGLHSAA